MSATTTTTSTTSTVTKPEPSSAAFINILQAAVGAMKTEYIQTLSKYEQDTSRLTTHRHFFKNKVSADFRNTIENCHAIAAQENQLECFAKELIEAWKDLVQFIYLPPKDVRSAPVPAEIADWVAEDLMFRLRGKQKTSYEHFVRSRGLVFQGIIDEVRSTMAGSIPLNMAVKMNQNPNQRNNNNNNKKQNEKRAAAVAAMTTNNNGEQEEEDEEKINQEVQKTISKKKIPSTFSFSTFGSTSSLDSYNPSSTPEKNHPQQQQQRDGDSPVSPPITRSATDTTESIRPSTTTTIPTSKEEPVYKKIIKSIREENARIAQIIRAIFIISERNRGAVQNTISNSSTGRNDDDDENKYAGDSFVAEEEEPTPTYSISLHALFEICKLHDAFSKQHVFSDEKIRRSFSKRVFEIVHRGLIPECHLAVTDNAVIDIAAMIASSQTSSTSIDVGAGGVIQRTVSPGITPNQTPNQATRGRNAAFPTDVIAPRNVNSSSNNNSPSSTSGVSTNNNNGTITIKSPLIVSDNTYYDQYFGILVHLLYANFHIKPNKAKGIIPEIPYAGHNICCVAINREGKIVGLDFNQCKQDQNLCSHAEKRLSEALNEKLKSTVAPNTPPSLEEFTFISSLEPCHMCANFVSRMGVKKIGYLMKDPMQCDALNVAASMLGLTILRPAKTSFVADTLETSFKMSEFPEEEITSWLGDVQCKKVLSDLKDKLPIQEGSECDKFMKRCGTKYPGVVIIQNGLTASPSPSYQTLPEHNTNHNVNTNIDNAENNNNEDGEDMEDFGMVFTTSSILAGMGKQDDTASNNSSAAMSRNSNDDDDEEEEDDSDE